MRLKATEGEPLTRTGFSVKCDIPSTEISQNVIMIVELNSVGTGSCKYRWHVITQKNVKCRNMKKQQKES